MMSSRVAAGAMSSPRLLQDYQRSGGLTLPCGDLVGANFKMHLNPAVIGFSPFHDHDILRKTAVLYNDRFPHSSMQCLGWIDGDLVLAVRRAVSLDQHDLTVYDHDEGQAGDVSLAHLFGKELIGQRFQLARLRARGWLPAGTAGH